MSRPYVYFKPVCPYIALRLLLFFKANNDVTIVPSNLYKDVTIVPSNIPTALVDSWENKNVELADVDFAKENL